MLFGIKNLKMKKEADGYSGLHLFQSGKSAGGYDRQKGF